MAQVTVYIDDDLIAKVDERAAAEGCNRSQYFARAVLAREQVLEKTLRRRLAKRMRDFVMTVDLTDDE